MVNRSMAKGTKAETAVADVLEHYYPLATRLAKHGTRDVGDIGGIDPRLVLEVKAQAVYDLPGWLREADAERVNAGADLAAVWFKLKGTTDPMAWPVMLRGRYFVPMLRAWTAAMGDQLVLPL